ncbi:hypothetical protein, partial [Streptomyces cadmiisoli]|uniref:hypothetical protein n=1 Tax=Streptomyces cadmiisoli TaxID=2184053 RepID=UPI0036627BBC
AMAIACMGGASPTTGADSERGAVDAYVVALNSKNTEALSELATPGNDPKTEVADRVARLGGRDMKVAKLELLHEFGPDFATAHLSIRAQDGATHDEILGLSRHDGRWYITMGQNPSPSKTPASTARP